MSREEQTWIAVPSQRFGAKSWQGCVALIEHYNTMQSKTLESSYCKHRHQSRATAKACAEKRLVAQQQRRKESR